MAKDKVKVKPAAPKKTGAKRGKKQPRRWAQKLDAHNAIINSKRAINHDDDGTPFPGDTRSKLKVVTDEQPEL